MRRRGEQLESAIRGAVLALLAEHGPTAVTMEAVAAAARTSKPVLYRRWSDGRELLRDSLLHAAQTAIPHEDTGSYRTDMLAVLRGWAALFTGPQGATMRAAGADHEQIRCPRVRPVRPVRPDPSQALPYLRTRELGGGSVRDPRQN